MFQSTRPRGARRSYRSRVADHGCFNPRARAGRDQDRRSTARDASCFNPRARAGRDGPDRECGVVGVSIHAPARGATAIKWPDTVRHR